jgi:hypothetical protein
LPLFPNSPLLFESLPFSRSSLPLDLPPALFSRTLLLSLPLDDCSAELRKEMPIAVIYARDRLCLVAGGNVPILTSVPKLLVVSLQLLLALMLLALPLLPSLYFHLVLELLLEEINNSASILRETTRTRGEPKCDERNGR